MPLNLQKKPKPKNAVRPLLTNERSQKFDLLLHLISNIRDGIVICGPNGIGKSMMLDLVQASGMKNWSVCRVNAANSTCFEEIQNTLAESIAAATGTSLQNDFVDNLNSQLDRFKRDGKLLVLLVDNAGDMAPGVLTAVCGFADGNPALRPVFTMTADRLHLTLSSDPVLANCQVIDIPPLTESQCGEFLQNLSGKPSALISFKAVSPAMVQYVYRKSHGVPGNIIAILPELTKEQFIPPPVASWPIVALLTLVGAAGAGYFLWNWNGNSNGSVPFSPHSGMRSREDTEEPVSLERRKAASFDSGQKTLSPDLISKTPGVSEPQVVAETSENAALTEQKSLEITLPFSNTDQTLKENPRSFSGLEGAISESVSGSGDSDASLQLNESEGQSVKNGAASVMTDLKNDPGMEKPSTGKSPEETVEADESLLSIGKQSATATPEPDSAIIEKVAESGDPEESRTGREKQDPQSPAELSSSPNLIAGVSGQSWIMQQDSELFTLQLLATVKLDAMKDFVKSNPELDDLAIFRTNRNGTMWYALISGVYPSLTDAKQAAEKLPIRLRNAWPRRFKSVQNAMVRSE